MASIEHLKIIKDGGVEWWNNFRQENYDGELVPDLSNAQFIGADFEDADFTYTNLEESNFIRANLTGADFSYSNLEYADFSNANLSGTNFEEANLDGARLDNSEFTCANLYGATLKDASLTETDFEAASIDNTNFQNANLRGANLNGASIEKANLSYTLLSRIQALATSFKGTVLTGACIQDWNINNDTILDDVICDYIYLKEGKKERIPHDSTKIFKPGEFAKYIEKALNTVDLIFTDGIDWRAFFASFQTLQDEYAAENIGVQAIEKKSDGAFIVRVEVPPNADKGEIESRAKQLYEIQLQALEGQYRAELKGLEAHHKDEIIKLRKEHNTQILELAKLAASRPITVEAKVVAEKKDTRIDLRGSKFGGGFAAEGGRQSGGTLNDYSITIGQNIDDIERLIASLRENIQHFPEKQREDAEMELEDLEEDIKNPEKHNPKRLARRLKRIAAIGTAVTALTGGAVTVSDNLNTFTDNITELGEKLEVPIESLKARLEDQLSLD